MNTTFDAIADGTPVYLDTNILVYAWEDHAEGFSRDCFQLMERCRKQNLFGLVSTVTLAELCHRAMCLEARKVEPAIREPHRYLQEHPDFVRDLREYARYVGNLVTFGNLGIIEIAEADLVRSQEIRDRYGLLTNDSIVAHVILDYGIPAIATNDPDFERVDGLRVFRPSDI